MGKVTAKSPTKRKDGSIPIDQTIAAHAKALSTQLNSMRGRLFPPEARKQLRRFAPGEAAKLLGVTDARIRQVLAADEALEAEKGPAGRRTFTLAQVHEIRRHLAKAKPTYSPARNENEHLQVIAVTNFKGGSGKTTSAAHLSQYFALKGYRVLAIDLDPQASLSALFGYQPEFDVAPGQTLYGAIRYDEHRRPLHEIIRRTYFTGLDLIPGNLELHEFEHDTPRMLAQRTGRDSLFFSRVSDEIATVANLYDVVVIDCPPQLGFLTLSALCAATAVLITIHPQMLDVASMSQFLQMTAGLLSVVREAGGDLNYDFMRYLVTRYEPNDGPQTQMVGFLRNLFGNLVMTNPMLKSTAVSDAGLTKQTLYEVDRGQFTRQTYDRALEALDAVNGEIEAEVRSAWGRVS